MEKLTNVKPCPFCGSTDITYFNGWRGGSSDRTNDIGRSPSIGCPDHYLRIGWYGFGISDDEVREEVITEWNKRS